MLPAEVLSIAIRVDFLQPLKNLGKAELVGVLFSTE